MTDGQMNSEGDGAPGSALLETMAQRIVDCQLVPIISASVGDEPVLGNHRELEEAYADQYHVPRRDLPEMAQIASITDPGLADLPAVKDGYIKFIRKRLLARVAGKIEANVIEEAKSQKGAAFSKFCDLLQYPRFEDNSPLLILAKFDLPVFITTSYHGFLESALRSVGKEPRTEFCRWDRKLELLPKNIDRGYVPTAQEPLVYHLRGYDGTKDSLALTEDEHLCLLMECFHKRGDDDPAGPVRLALEGSSLILLGYNLRSWEFRSILWGLLRRRADKTRQSVSIQLDAGDVDRRYFNKYMNSPEIHLEAYWGTVEEYLETVRKAVDKAMADE